MTATAGFDGGTVTAANIETVNLTATDTLTSTGITAHTLTLTADKATTVKVSGNAGVDLTLTGSAKIATLDASDATGVVTVTSVSTAAITIKGGSAADVLTAASGTNADVLIGNGGADTLTTNAGLTSLTGGSGLDLFVIGTAGASGSVYSSIQDALPGDRIQLINTNTETFTTTKVALASTASFTDYLNTAAVASTGATNGIISWFQYGANTYIVEDNSAATTFVGGADVVVELVGLIDLSTASLSNTAGAPILMIG
jgi:S-layer protein